MVESSTRLYALLARQKPTGIVLRRGPSRQVQLLKWDLVSDKLSPGQWFKGRVYERRCDLSPDGEYLIYFAANHKPPYGTWTAISRAPFFTALALWPKGDTWGGGGLFDADSKGITLNHRSSEIRLAEGFTLPSNFRVRQHGDHAGWGEDEPILSHRFVRDGWSLESKGTEKENKFGSKIWFEFIEPQVWVKKSQDQQTHIRLELHGINERQGAWYVHNLKYQRKQEKIDLGRCDWADITDEGIVYFSIDGLLKKKLPLQPIVAIVADLSENTFEAIEPSDDACRW